MATQADIQASLDAIWGKLTPEQQEELRSEYSRTSDGIRTGLTTLEEQTRQLQEQQAALNQWRGQLRNWAHTKETEIQTREAELARRAADPTRPATPPPNGGSPAAPGQEPAGQPGNLERDEFGRVLQTFGRDVMATSSELFRLHTRHQQLYGNERVFDPDELYRHPQVMEIGLSRAFEDIHKDRIKAANEKAAADAEAKIRADERQKVIAEQGSSKTLPFPTPGEDDSPMGILQRRQQGEEKEAFGVEAAVAEYRRMRAGSGLPA
jgi:hypothetical protein